MPPFVEPWFGMSVKLLSYWNAPRYQAGCSVENFTCWYSMPILKLC
jgi:hypothetical protein